MLNKLSSKEIELIDDDENVTMSESFFKPANRGFADCEEEPVRRLTSKSSEILKLETTESASSSSLMNRIHYKTSSLTYSRLLSISSPHLEFLI